jgi:hypothetical protein
MKSNNNDTGENDASSAPLTNIAIGVGVFSLASFAIGRATAGSSIVIAFVVGVVVAIVASGLAVAVAYNNSYQGKLDDTNQVYASVAASDDPNDTVAFISDATSQERDAQPRHATRRKRFQFVRPATPVWSERSENAINAAIPPRVNEVYVEENGHASSSSSSDEESDTAPMLVAAAAVDVCIDTGTNDLYETEDSILQDEVVDSGCDTEKFACLNNAFVSHNSRITLGGSRTPALIETDNVSRRQRRHGAHLIGGKRCDKRCNLVSLIHADSKPVAAPSRHDVTMRGGALFGASKIAPRPQPV